MGLIEKWETFKMSLFKFKKRAHFHPLIKAWREYAKKEGGCIQCRHPWYDGSCRCKFKDEHLDLYRGILKLAYRLEGEGWEL